ncbi:MAG: hypothetical protein SGCHY_004491 [Lobulomycetales sp.]
MLSHDNFTTSNTRNKYIKNYAFRATWQDCDVQVVMTSVSGHLMSSDFDSDHRKWNSCDPEDLYSARIQTSLSEDCKVIGQNIQKEARSSQVLFIWTDCDREGEHIGSEVAQIASTANNGILIKRAKFSVMQPPQIRHAWAHPVDLDWNQARAVAARIELDLRIGASFTRLQTLKMQNSHAMLDKKVLSFGTCQFPTLGFVVDQFLKAKEFVEETFWYIAVSLCYQGSETDFSWSRNHLFDRQVTMQLYESCAEDPRATVTSVQNRPTQKWCPLPLTTVELQKMASIKLRMSSDRVMNLAEALYNRGFISYPRTETDIFEPEFDLFPLIRIQEGNPTWGSYASRYFASLLSPHH